MSLVVLINPKISKNRKSHPTDQAAREPLSILVLGSYLKTAGFKVKLIDAVIYEEGLLFKMIADIITKRTGPLLIGISVMTAQISHALEISDFVKSLDKKVPIIWGGPHPTLFPAQTSLDDSIDIVVQGRGEAPLLEICRRFAINGAIPCDIPGTSVKGKVNSPIGADKLEDVYLDYELLDLKRYLGPLPHYLLSETPNRALQIISSRGCPWRCGYCINTATKNRWEPLNPERYIAELQNNITKFNLDAYRVMDEDFFVSKERIFAIVDDLESRGIDQTWGANIRANYFQDGYVSEKFAKKLKATGCKFLSLGAESGSQRVLDLIKKDITVDRIIRSAEVCGNAGIIPIYSWMIGIPTQTDDEILETIEIMKKISRICPSAIHYPFWIFRPFPGGSLYDLCLQNGLDEPKTLRGWSEKGAGEDVNTGFYSVDNLPWIKDVKFIRFLSKYGNKIPSAMNRSVISRIKALFVHSVLINRKNLLARVALDLLC